MVLASVIDYICKIEQERHAALQELDRLKKINAVKLRRRVLMR
jgi:hypothetical protein